MNSTLTHIQVTPRDIDSGTRLSCRFCPVALAINRTLPVNDDGRRQLFPIVRRKYVDIADSYGSRVSLPLPLPVQEFISRYDFDDTVFPFQFELDIPQIHP